MPELSNRLSNWFSFVPRFPLKLVVCVNLVLSGLLFLHPAPASETSSTELKTVKEFEVDGDEVTAVRFSRDGKFLAASYRAAHPRIWNPRTDDEVSVLDRPLGIWTIYQIMAGGPPPTNTLSFAPEPPWEAEILAAGYHDGVRLWNARQGSILFRLPKSAAQDIQSLTFSPEGVFLGAGSLQGVVSIWNTRSQKVMRQFRGHQTFVGEVAFSPVPVGKYLVSGTQDGHIRIWNWRKDLGGQKDLNDTEAVHVKTLQAHDSGSEKVFRAVVGLVFLGQSAESLSLISAAFDGTIRIWSVPEGERLKEFQVDHVNALALSPNEEILAVAHGEKLTLRSLSTGEILAEGQEHTNPIQTVAFSPSGEWIATGSGVLNPRGARDDRIILWENPFFEPGPPRKGGDSPDNNGSSSDQSGGAGSR